MNLSLFMDRLLEKSDREISLWLFSAAFLIACPMLVLYFEIGSDPAAYYIPMAEEFAKGNFGRAFYPMIPPLFPALNGSICMLTGLPAFGVAKFLSILFMALTIFPLYLLVRDGRGERRQAVYSCILLMVCPLVIRHAGYGEIDTGKMFFLTLCGWSLVAMFRKPALMPALVFGTAAAGMSLVRGEGIAVALLLFPVLLAGELWGGDTPEHRPGVAWRTMAGAVLMFLLLSPWIAYEYRTTGYPVTDSRQIEMLRHVAESLSIPFPERRGSLPAEDPEIEKMVDAWQARQQKAGQASPALLRIWNNLILETIKGVYEFYFPFLLAGLWLLWKQKRLRSHDLLLGWLWCANTLVFLAASNFSLANARYVMQALPFTLPWTAIGLEYALTRLRQRLSYGMMQKAVAFLAFVLVVAGNERAIGDVYKRLADSESKAMVAAGQWLRDEGILLIRNGIEPLPSTDRHYHPGRVPIVLFGHRRAGGLAGTGVFYLKNLVQQPCPVTVRELTTICRLKDISFIAVDETLLAYCPELDREAPAADLTLLRSFGEQNQVRIFGYLPNLRKAISG